MPTRHPEVVTTARLTLRRMVPEDAPFVLGLLNEPAFKRNIGDKGVRTLDDARRYIEDVPIAHYQAYGFGAYLVSRLYDGVPVGMCGLYQRSNLDRPDLGFALAEAFHGQGYAREAAAAVLAHARKTLGLTSVAAIVDADNERSIHLLERLGFERRGRFRLPNDAQDLDYFERAL